MAGRVLQNKPGDLDIVIAKGEKFVAAFVDNDLTDYSTYTIEMDVRSTADSADTLYTASTTGGEITFDGNGSPILTITAATTTAWAFTEGVYDMKFTSSGGSSVSFFFEGKFIVKQTVTR